MTAHPDPTALREAAFRLTADSWGVYHPDYESPDSVSEWEKLADKLTADGAKLANAYLALTDPTPLSVEVLVGMGGTASEKAEFLYTVGPFTVYMDEIDPEFWDWYFTTTRVEIHPAPRTAGELRQLLDRMGK